MKKATAKKQLSIPRWTGVCYRVTSRKKRARALKILARREPLTWEEKLS